MEPHFPSLPPKELEETPKEDISLQQQVFAYHPAAFYPGYAYGTPYSHLMGQPVLLAVTQVVPVPHYFVDPTMQPSFQVHPHPQYVDIGVNTSPCVTSLCRAPCTTDSCMANSQNYPINKAPQDLGSVAPTPTSSEKTQSVTHLSSSSSGSNTSMSSNTSVTSSQLSSSHQPTPRTCDSSPIPDAPKLPLTPNSPPGLTRTGKRSSNDPRPSDALHGFAQPQSIAYIPRKRPIIPDLLYIPRLLGQSNFKEWDELMQTLLIQMRIYDHIHNLKQKPHICGIAPSYPPAVHRGSSKEEKQRSADWWANDACVKMILSMRLSKPIMQMALAWEGGDTAREMYKLLWRMYGPPSSRREERLLSVDIKMG